MTDVPNRTPSLPVPQVPDRLSIGPRIVALDLDGTLLPRSFELSPLTVRTLSAVRASGVRVILATGRMYRSALRYAQQLGLTEALIAYQGAMIVDISSGETLFHAPIGVGLAREVLLPLEAEGHSINVYVDDALYVREWTEDVRRYQRVSQVEVHAVGRLSDFLTVPTTKIVVTGESRRLDHLAATLSGRFDGRLYIAKSLPFFLEIASPLVSKSNALALLGRRYGFTRQDVVAFGDSFNDADMLEWAGLGVAMANAPEAVRQAADVVCGSVDEDGVARFLLESASGSASDRRSRPSPPG